MGNPNNKRKKKNKVGRSYIANRVELTEGSRENHFYAGKTCRLI